jgi:hypothetical protein
MSRRDKHATWKLAPAAIAALEKLAPPKDLEGIGAALLASTADVFKEPAAAAAAVALASACQLNSLAAERDEELSWPLAEVELPKRGRTEGQTLETERALAVLGWELAKTGGEKLRPTTIVKAYLRTQGYNEGEALDNRADYVVRAFNKKA